ncbi:FxsB family radical SAM/SPASM domain protein [Variovorax paradoxus]|uniref:cyclophane-forming radical SAM/SPASM peptide maturase YhhB n=1 Tax=Variovorax paradoxus TaxID=34073 RepID=UPI00215E770A|nr:cyclophane-forming radical SAM/SPASM peptide maturase YhhB [Variovorax paradoxus]UVH55169.1 FxsB family radical SAM/SPASM domain protein [Variovorax paradoxus]
MAVSAGEVQLTSFLVKVASRCNLDCDYCYVYHHADQSWRSMPRLLSLENREAFASNLASYVQHAEIRRCVVVFHGGEPLLMGSSELVAFAAQLREAVGADVQLDIGMQTNGLLLTREAIDEFSSADIGISLSLDGPKEANDLHRTSRRGRSSFEQTYRALQLLRSAPDVFAGVIAVIDPRTPPRQLLEFFSEQQVPRLDFLLPDAHHLRPPPGRLEQPDVYERWLIDAFDIWFTEYSGLQVRTFEALLDAVAGMPSQTDAFGFGDVSLITVETDGTFHDLDVLKVVSQGATRLDGSVRDTPISDVAASTALAAHRALLKKEGLCASCRSCDVVDVCGGGSVPHRHGLNGFKNPTIYCKEMRALIRHVQARIADSLELGTPTAVSAHYSHDMGQFECAETSMEAVASLWANAISNQSIGLRRALHWLEGSSSDSGEPAAAKVLLDSPSTIDLLAQRPGAIAWSNAMLAIDAGRPVSAVDGSPLGRDAGYANWMLARLQESSEQSPEVHGDDAWLRRPFGNAIHFEGQEILPAAEPLLHEALEILHAWRPAVAQELRRICRAVQFIRDPAADPDKIVSFSDNAVPGALYVSVTQRAKLVDAYDLADSLLHEYRHQKLYLLERVAPVVESTSRKVVSPWRQDLRPPSGLFHAVFVFVELRRFWKHVRSLNVDRLNTRAENQLMDTDARLSEAFLTLAGCPLTATGRSLVAVLEAAAQE